MRLQGRHQTSGPGKLATPGRRALLPVVTLLSPFVLLALLEIGLRLFRLGPDISLFTTEVIGGRMYHIMNPGVKARYFSNVKFAPATSPDYFLVPKPPGTFRIFCLGGSTTVGFPYWYNGSFASFLRDRLRATFPGRSLEVINMGMTATNSFTVVDFANELVDYEPDLFVVYDGHNEFYGALGASSNDSPGHSRLLTEAYLRLVHFRVFLLLRSLFRWATDLLHPAAGAEPGGTMMERLARGQFVPYRSPLYLDALSNFERNLDKLVRITGDHHIPLLLASQVSNLRDRPPFVADFVDAVPDVRRAQFSAAMERGSSDTLRSDCEAALGEYRAAVAADSTRADAHFALARCLDLLGRHGEARPEYALARDDDQLRFRASSDFNDALRDHADGHQVLFVDMERSFEENSPDSLIGSTLIVDHLHPNSRGSFLMAKAYAAAMREHGLLGLRDEWAAAYTASDESLWRDRSLTELDELIARETNHALTSGWPFRAVNAPLEPYTTLDTLGRIAAHAVTGRWSWVQSHNAAADYYAGEGNLAGVEKEYRVILREVPLDVLFSLKLARVYLDEGNPALARQELLSSLAEVETPRAYRSLGEMSLAEGNAADASVWLEKLSRFDRTADERADDAYLLAVAYARAAMPERAVAALQEVLSMKPDHAAARRLLTSLRKSGP